MDEALRAAKERLAGARRDRRGAGRWGRSTRRAGTRTTAPIEAAYLEAGTPQGQAGHSGDDRRWEQARRLVLDACERPGTFLDIGCANGLLMESVADWSDGTLEPYGVDVSAERGTVATAGLLGSWGFQSAGTSTRPHRHPALCYRAVDGPAD